nr:unnamed protein product [Callosobruchus analis]
MDTEMEEIMNTMVECLFSVFVTLGTVPIIRSPKGNAAEMVAKRLEKKLRDHLFDARNSLFTPAPAPDGGLGGGGAGAAHFAFQRPLLLVLDRNVDMATPLHHTWTYQALAHDVLDLALNRLVIEESQPTGGARAKSRTCELDSRDKFWGQHKGSPFPTVAEAIQEELEQYKSSEEEVKKLRISMGLLQQDDDKENDAMAVAMASTVSDNTARITSAVNSLPQLLDQKRLLDMHTSIATCILNGIKSRKLDTFFELEEKIMSKAQGLEKPLMEILSDATAGAPDDKLRLFIIFYICSQQISDADLRKYEEALLRNGCDLTPIAYIKRWKSFIKMASGGSSLNQYEGAGTKTVSMFSKLVSQGSNFVMEGVKNLVIKRHNLPVTKVVDNLMELKNCPEMEEYHYLDPKQLKVTEIPRNRSPFQEAIVFMVGGGNYIEYQNLVDYAKAKTTSGSSRKIVYGATTLNNAKQFLKQLSLLGQEL